MVVVIIGIILFFALFIFIRIKINNFTYRAKQQVLGKVGLGASNINAGINQSMENGALTKILNDYPNLTEKYIKDTIYSMVTSLVNKQNIGYFSEKVTSKMMNDNKLDLIKNMQFVRINILGYKDNLYSAVVVYTDGRDEYQITVMGKIDGNLYIDTYDAMKGIAKGF